ncbi:hypothetical protein [Kitasatospora sp. NBC_01302]|uniref:hypothetical protein n=1 Tax=Kitasatospora sp. NBC_01302 TaxID=2903575 RepID=UPI002E0FE45B|nr:hypothetical protein OG294_09225 [Kitasatospora sp. NBC_01302]
MSENTPNPTPSDVNETFTALVADLPDPEISASEDEFACEDCGGLIEAAAPLWFNITRRADGTPALDVYGVGIEAATISCADCGRDAGDHLNRLITDAMCPIDAALTGLEV